MNIQSLIIKNMIKTQKDYEIVQSLRKSINEEKKRIALMGVDMNLMNDDVLCSQYNDLYDKLLTLDKKLKKYEF